LGSANICKGLLFARPAPQNYEKKYLNLDFQYKIIVPFAPFIAEIEQIAHF
jgi:hypothetical protein